MDAAPGVEADPVGPAPLAYQVFGERFPCALLLLGSDLAVEWTTPTAGAVLGYCDGALIGRSVAELLHPDDLDQIAPMVAAVLSRAGEAVAAPTAAMGIEVAARVVDGDGHYRPMAVSGRIVDDSGRVLVAGPSGLGAPRARPGARRPRTRRRPRSGARRARRPGPRPVRCRRRLDRARPRRRRRDRRHLVGPGDRRRSRPARRHPRPGTEWRGDDRRPPLGGPGPLSDRRDALRRARAPEPALRRADALRPPRAGSHREPGVPRVRASGRRSPAAPRCVDRPAHRRAEPTRVRIAAWRAPRCDRRTCRSACSSSTSTASRRSTTSTVTPSATPRSSPWPVGSPLTVRGPDSVGRLGGDEFAVSCPGLSGPAAEAMRDRLRSAFVEPVPVRDRRIELSVTIGVATATDETSLERVVDRSDADMYDRKHRTRRRNAALSSQRSDAARHTAAVSTQRPDQVSIGECAARAGVAGNPSDALGGAALAVPVAQLRARVEVGASDAMTIRPAAPAEPQRSVSSLVSAVGRYGHEGAERLVTAALVRLVAHLHGTGREVDDTPLDIVWCTEVPRSVGLAGSSALAIATIRALADRWRACTWRRSSSQRWRSRPRTSSSVSQRGGWIERCSPTTHRCSSRPTGSTTSRAGCSRRSRPLPSGRISSSWSPGTRRVLPRRDGSTPRCANGPRRGIRRSPPGWRASSTRPATQRVRSAPVTLLRSPKRSTRAATHALRSVRSTPSRQHSSPVARSAGGAATSAGSGGAVLVAPRDASAEAIRSAFDTAGLPSLVFRPGSSTR